MSPRASDPMAAHAIPSTAERAWLRLRFEIDRLVDDDTPPPCVGRDAGLWISEHVGEREAAAHRCGSCPALDACQQYADTAREPFGVWAGRDRSKTTKRRKEATA